MKTFHAANPLVIPILISMFVLNSGCATEKNVSSAPQQIMAPDIVSQDTGGNSIKLSDNKGKMVLVEFWCASSMQCRKNHVLLNSLYSKYRQTVFKNGNGFTVFSVSLDKDPAAWKKAIKEDSPGWPTQVCDLKGWDSEAVMAYDVHSMPKYFLLDGDGRVLSKNILIKDLDGMLKQYTK